MSFPNIRMPVPDVVSALADGRPVRAVWVNGLGGVTFTIDSGAEYVKTCQAEHGALLGAESVRLRWPGQFITVPTVLGEGNHWLHTAGLPGHTAVDPRWSQYLGVTDRWADPAIATMSLEWNFPGNHEGALLDAYGVAPDSERIAYYRQLWDDPESG